MTNKSQADLAQAKSTDLKATLLTQKKDIIKTQSEVFNAVLVVVLTRKSISNPDNHCQRIAKVE